MFLSFGKVVTDICKVTKGEEGFRKKIVFIYGNVWKCFLDIFFFFEVIFEVYRVWGLRFLVVF